MVDRLRELFGAPASAALVLLMLAGCLVLWIVIPVVWLWIGSQVQSSASLGTALMVTMLGVVASILLMAVGLSWLNRQHAHLREARNLPTSEYTALEAMLVASAGIAVVVFGVWFFGFAGSSPIPLNVGF